MDEAEQKAEKALAVHQELQRIAVRSIEVRKAIKRLESDADRRYHDQTFVDAANTTVQKLQAEQRELHEREVSLKAGYLDLEEEAQQKALATSPHPAPSTEWDPSDLEPVEEPTYPKGARQAGDTKAIEEARDAFDEWATSLFFKIAAEHGLGPSHPVNLQEALILRGQIMASKVWEANRFLEIEERVAALEAGLVVGTKYMGVWQRQQRYTAGSLVTHKSALWHCNTDSTGVEPGDGNKAFTLCAKGDSVPLPQRDTAGKRITGNEPRKPRKIERTIVTGHDAAGRIASFDKEIIEE